MPIDYKALEEQLEREQAARAAVSQAGQVKAQAEMLERFKKRAEPLARTLVPEIEALRSQMAGKYSVDFNGNLESESVTAQSAPTVTFEITNESTGTKSGQIVVEIRPQKPRPGRSMTHGPEVALISADARGQRLDLNHSLGIDLNDEMTDDIAARIVTYAFKRAVAAGT
jgi:hypothetical protein